MHWISTSETRRRGAARRNVSGRAGTSILVVPVKDDDDDAVVNGCAINDAMARIADGRREPLIGLF